MLSTLPRTHCAVAFVERDEHRKLLVAGDFGVGLDQLIGECGRAEPLEVHREERDLRRNIAIAQPLAELDAIDHIDLIFVFVVYQADVLGAQVAVAFANATLVRAVVQYSPMSRDKGATESVDRGELELAQRMSYERFVLCDVLDHVTPNCRRRTVGPSAIRRAPA